MINFFIYSLFFSLSFCAVFISGKVVDESGNPISYANVYIKDSFDGTSTNDNGEFEFETFEVNQQVLIASYVGYEEYSKEINIPNDLIDISENPIVLTQSAAQMTEVVITAGSFEASDENRAAILKPLDIVTTAGARGDITGALQSLPGSQPQNEKEGLFVRGGDAVESKTIVDGLLIQNPYDSSVPDIPQRGRFTPFEFEGTVFSTGGYSAQYGQALSSVVDLTTWNRFDEIDAHTVGVTPLNLTYGRAYGTDDITCSFRLDLNDLTFFQDANNNGFFKNFIKSDTEFIDAPHGYKLNTSFKKKLSKGIIKYYGRYQTNALELDFGAPDKFVLDNSNLYTSFTYSGEIANSWVMQVGFSYSENEDIGGIFLESLQSVVDAGQLDLAALDISSYDRLAQLRTVFTKSIFSSAKVKFGAHFFNRNSKFDQIQTDYENFFNFYNRDINELLSSGFMEMDFKLSSKLAMRFGIRGEQSQFLDKSNFSPRLSIAYKVGRFDQISYAYGTFYQTPEIGLDQWFQRTQPTPDYEINNNGFLDESMSLDFEKATHHIFNYQWIKGKRVFRMELYDKDYDNLIKSDSQSATDEFGNFSYVNNLDNNGYGYARGLDLFWRDNGYSFQDIDYWISYSYLDTKRNYRDYTADIRPSFAAEHVLSIIYKQSFQLKDTGLQLSLGLTGTSGRPWYDNRQQIDYDGDVVPNPAFGENVAKPYQAFNIGGSILPKVSEGNFMVIFFNIENPFGYDNSYGFRYNDITGNYEEVKPSSLRSLFIGCFMFFSIGSNQDELKR